MNLELLCGRCGHPQSWHRHDDVDPTPVTDHTCPFRCLGYDCELPGRPPLGNRVCDCQDWVAPGGERAMRAAFGLRDDLAYRERGEHAVSQTDLLDDAINRLCAAVDETLRDYDRYVVQGSGKLPAMEKLIVARAALDAVDSDDQRLADE